MKRLKAKKVRIERPKRVEIELYVFTAQEDVLFKLIIGSTDV